MLAGMNEEFLLMVADGLLDVVGPLALHALDPRMCRGSEPRIFAYSIGSSARVIIFNAS